MGAPDWDYDPEEPLPTFAYRHALEETEAESILRLIPRDGRIDLSFNGRWFLRRDALHNSIPSQKRLPGTDTRSLLNNVEMAVEDLGQFGVLDITDFDPGSHNRVNYRLSKGRTYVSNVKNQGWSFNDSVKDIRTLSEKGLMLPNCPTTKITAGWNRVM